MESFAYLSHDACALWNPATRQVREIVDAPIEGPDFSDMAFLESCSWYGSGFCFDPITNAFKVVQFRLNVIKEETRAQVNVFSTATNSWTEKNIPVPSRIRLRSPTTIRGVSCVNGYMHWRVSIFPTSSSSNLEDMFILRYDMAGEVFERIEMPIAPLFLYYHIAPYEGSLAVFVNQRTASGSSFNGFDLWVLNGCGGANQSWSIVLTCRPSVMVRFFVGFFRKDNLDLILFLKQPDCSLHLYDPENGVTEKFGKRVSGMHAFLYSESLALT